MADTIDKTAQALLESARRAEHDGNFDIAVRAYQHITVAYPHLPEARIAADALARRAQSASASPGTLITGGGPNLAIPARRIRPDQPATPQTRASNVAQLHPPPGASTPPSHHAPQQQLSALHQPQRHAPTQHHTAPQRTQPRPTPPRYVFGRLIAHFAGFSGAIIIIAALFAAVLNLSAIFGLITTPTLLQFIVSWQLITLVTFSGLFLVLLSQMARAIFDTADTAHQLSQR